MLFLFNVWRGMMSWTVAEVQASAGALVLLALQPQLSSTHHECIRRHKNTQNNILHKMMPHTTTVSCT